MSNLSEAQKEILLVEYFYPKSSATTVGLYLNLGIWDIKEVIVALETVMSFHDCFRMKLRENGEEVERYYDENVSSIIVHYCNEDDVKAHIAQKSNMNFFGWNQYLYEIDVYEIRKGEVREVYLSFFANHVLVDGFAMHLFVKDVCNLIEKREFQKPLLTLDECVQEEQLYRTTKRNDENKMFWQEKIASYEGFALCGNKQAPSGQLQTTGYLGKLDLELTQKIMTFCDKNGISLTQLLSGLLLFYKSKMTNSDSVSLGTTLHGRSNQKKKTVVATFARFLPLIVHVDSNMSVLDYLAMIKTEMSQLIRNYRISYGDMMDMMEQVSGLDDISLSVQINEELRKKYLNFSGSWVKANEKIKPLTIHIKEEDDSDCLYFDYEFLLSVFTLSDIKKMHKKLENILFQMLSSTSKLIKEISLVDEQERELIVHVFNDTYREYPRDKTVVELFEEQVKKRPNHVAVVFEETSITYQELNERANVLAYKLRDLGVKPDDYVAIMAERSMEMIVGILSVIKAGGAYVPLDPTHPQERMAYILEDCQPTALLTSQNQIVIEMNIPLINLTAPDVLIGKVENPDKVNQLNHLLYLIYTSGTTGKPKGVMIEHRNVLNLVEWHREAGNLDKKTIILQNFNYIFDGSVWEIFPALLSGCTLEIIPEEGRYDLKKVLELLPGKQITMTPSMFKVMVDDAQEHELLAELNAFKRLYIAGESLSYDLIERYKKMSGGKIENIFNAYGPTEATVCATVYRFDQDDDKILIGKPISNTQVYILNGERLCGIGIPGELCIAGEGLARGYLNQPELTAEKFVDNPYGEGKLYRSGDLARWLPDGNMEYLGRIDEQVKIRGFRIELGEIESAIQQLEEIKGCAVITREEENGEKAINAYLVSNVELSMSQIRNSLVKSLSPYMIPSYMTQIESLPLTRNGKLDKRTLLEIKIEKEYVAPRTEIEERLCRIFEEILGIEEVGIKDDFFELGGHSLRATRLVNRMEAETGVRIDLKEVFSSPTVELLAEFVRKTEDIHYLPIPKAEIKEYYEMSPAQKRIYLIQQMDLEATTYNMPQYLKLTGEVNSERVNRALQELINRHEILRTSFMVVAGAPIQCIQEQVAVDFEYVGEVQNEKKVISEFVKPFDLSKASQLRGKLVKMSDCHLLMIDMHHIINDGMSIATLTSEFTALYNGKALEKLTHQFKDYSEWMRSRDLNDQKTYWMREFDDEIPTLDLPLDYMRPKEQSFVGATTGVETGKELGDKVKELARQMGTTEYMVFLASAMVLLGKYANQEDVVIGNPISGRTHQDTEQMLGMFVNTLAMRGRPEQEKSFKYLLYEVKESSLKAYENQEYPFEELVENINIRRDLSRNPLFDVMLVLQNNEEINLRMDGVSIEYVDSGNQVAKFDLTFNIWETKGSYKIDIEYCSALFKEETVALMLDHYVELVSNLIEKPEVKLKEISVVTEFEQRQILKEFNDTYVEYPREKTIVQLFEEQVKKTPDHMAIVFEDEQLTYKELNARANALAYKLRDLGVEPNDYVGIIAKRSIEMIIGIYGIIKASGAYVPIDPTYPIERIQYILRDCQPKVVLTYQIAVETLIPVIDLGEVEIGEGLRGNPVHMNKADDLIYLIYTSGTTGKPKGVMNQHRGLTNLIRWLQREYPLTEGDTLLQKTTYVFDVSASELFWWSTMGARLAILKHEAEKDPIMIMEAIEKYQISLINFVPSMLLMFTLNAIGLKGNAQKLKSLKYVLAAGEALTVTNINAFYEMNEKYGTEIKLGNIYGPTESSVYSTYYNCEKGISFVPIGRPISNIQAYILNQMNLCGIGIPGELCISGDGVSRGYLNRPDLTGEKFVDNPYGEGKLYRTGDLARWLPDGNIKYLGRIDEQVKIRGFRIEPGEIENVLRNQPGVRNCTVIIREDQAGDKALYGYVVSEEKIEVSSLKESLLKELPEYMIPAYMMQIDSVPLTRNGKLDKSALPEINRRTEAIYVAPRNEKEEILSEIFKKVLGVENASVKDNFFEMGGDSIKAMRVVSKMREAGYDLNVKDVMGGRTIEIMGENAEIAKEMIYEQGEVVGEIKQTPIIRAFENWELEEPHHFNQSIMVKVRGTAQEVEVSIQALVSHHDMLRAVYKEGSLLILGNEEKRYEYEVYDYQEKPNVTEKIKQVCGRKQTSMDLEKGPLFKCILFRMNKENYLFMCAHHLVVDGVSWRILVEDLHNGVGQLKKRKEIELPRKTASFKEWSEALTEYKESEQLSKEIAYWKKIEAEMKEWRYQKEEQDIKSGYQVTSFRLSKEETKKLLKESGAAYNTEINDLLLSALGMSVKEVRGQDRVAVTLEGHGREEIHKKIEVDRTVGWFTSMYPIILTCYDDIEESIIQTKEMLRKIPNHGMGYGLLSEQRTCDISFNYLGEISKSRESGATYHTGLDVSEKNIFPSGIIMNGMVESGRLTFAVSYDQSKYSGKEMNELVNVYKEKLVEEVYYCSNVKQSFITASDVTDEVINDNEFDNIALALGINL